MKDKAKIGLVLSLIAVLFLAVTGLNAQSSSVSDTDAIKTILVKAEIIPDQAYIDAKKSIKQGTLQQDEANIIKVHSDSIKELFSDTVSNNYIKSWINIQPNNAKNGGFNTVEAGVIAIEIKQLSISENTATVTANITKYLTDSITKDGKKYLDKLEGNVIINATLIKENGQWKITQYNGYPDMDSTKHTLTQEY